jgi:hypothetical protein
MTILSYILTFIGSFLALLIGAFSHLGFSFLLSWAPNALRARVAGFLGGFVSAGFSVAIGWWIFNWLQGPDSFTVAPFIISTLPVALAIPGDFKKARSDNHARDELLTGLRQSRTDEELVGIADMTHSPHRSSAFGSILGLILAGVWHILA